MESHELGQPTLQKDNFSEEVISKILEKGTSQSRNNANPIQNDAHLVNHVIHVVLESPSEHTLREKLGPAVKPCKICKDVVGEHHVIRKHTYVDPLANPYMCGICREAFRQGYLLKIHLEVEHGFLELDHNRRSLRIRNRGGQEGASALMHGHKPGDVRDRTSRPPSGNRRVSARTTLKDAHGEITSQSDTTQPRVIDLASALDKENNLLPPPDETILLTSGGNSGFGDDGDGSGGEESDHEGSRGQTEKREGCKNGDLIVINLITEGGGNSDSARKKSKRDGPTDVNEADRHRYKCDFCNLGFPTQRKRSLHAKHDHPGALLKCPNCEAEFTKKRLLIAHLKTHEEEKPSLKPKKLKRLGPPICTICDKTFLHQSGLQIHTQSFHPELITAKREFCCEVCGAMFWTKAAMVEHKKVHSDSRPFLCSYCKKGFCRKSDLKSHTKIHTGERPHSCTHCDRTFRQRPQLVNHLRVHTGERPYKCDMCEKAFKKRDQLTRHRRVHTKERPYKCPQCEKAFKTNGNLNDHVRVHTGDRPFKCSQCDKAFAQYTNKVHHERTHSGFKPYICKVCQKGFPRSNSLTAHMKTHTSKRAKAKPLTPPSNVALPLTLPTQSATPALQQSLVLPQGFMQDPSRLQLPSNQQPPDQQQTTAGSALVNTSEILASMQTAINFDEVAAKLAHAAVSSQQSMVSNLCPSVDSLLPPVSNMIGGQIGSVGNSVSSLIPNTILPAYGAMDSQGLNQSEPITVVGLLSNLSDFQSMQGSDIGDFQ